MHANKKNQNIYKDLTVCILEYTKAVMVLEGDRLGPGLTSVV